MLHSVGMLDYFNCRCCVCALLFSGQLYLGRKIFSEYVDMKEAANDKYSRVVVQSCRITKMFLKFPSHDE